MAQKVRKTYVVHADEAAALRKLLSSMSPSGSGRNIIINAKPVDHTAVVAVLKTNATRGYSTREG